LKLISYDETLKSSSIFQQTGGIAFRETTALPFDISLPFYDFEASVLDFTTSEVVNIQFGH